MVCKRNAVSITELYVTQASYLMILPSVKASQERQKRRKKKAMKKKAVHRTPSSTVSAPPDSPVELGLSEAEKKKAERRLQLLQVQTPVGVTTHAFAIYTNICLYQNLVNFLCFMIICLCRNLLNFLCFMIV